MLRFSLGTTIYAGTSEIHRNMIAQRGWGSPRPVSDQPGAGPRRRPEPVGGGFRRPSTDEWSHLARSRDPLRLPHRGGYRLPGHPHRDLGLRPGRGGHGGGAAPVGSGPGRHRRRDPGREPLRGRRHRPLRHGEGGPERDPGHGPQPALCGRAVRRAGGAPRRSPPGWTGGDRRGDQLPVDVPVLPLAGAGIVRVQRGVDLPQPSGHARRAHPSTCRSPSGGTRRSRPASPANSSTPGATGPTSGRWPPSTGAASSRRSCR